MGHIRGTTGLKALAFAFALLLFYRVAFAEPLWLVNYSAQASCQASQVVITTLFKNTEPSGSQYSMSGTIAYNGVVKNFVVASGQTASVPLFTALGNVPSGTVHIHVWWTDGHSGTDDFYPSFSSLYCGPTATDLAYWHIEPVSGAVRVTWGAVETNIYGYGLLKDGKQVKFIPAKNLGIPTPTDYRTRIQSPDRLVHNYRIRVYYADGTHVTTRSWPARALK